MMLTPYRLVASTFGELLHLRIPYHRSTSTHRFRIFIGLAGITYSTRVFISYDVSYSSLSIVRFFTGSHWYESEIFDMFGVVFIGNLSLHRLLTDYGFTGYPLRKDYPVSGFHELHYSRMEGRIFYSLLDNRLQSY